MKITPELVNQTHQSKKVLATIRADSADNAISYFKGRFGKFGKVKKTLGKNNFTVIEK